MTRSRQQSPARRVRPFTPSQESPAVLSDRTVGRESTLETMVARLVDAARTGNRAHTMLVGPRGSGKTHLLNVAVHRARQQVDVERRLVLVRFDEDAVGVHRYTDILAEAFASVAAAGLRRPRLSDTPEGDIAEALGDRVLVLAIENADRVFKSLGKEGQQAFRAWVEQSRQVLVFASSPSLFKGIQDRTLPWWGNFGVHHLQELSLDEGRELLIKLARESGDDELAEFLATPKAEGRLRAINALAGGSPRVWMILSECLTVETLDELVPAVEALLEGLVPYYQQLLWDLSDVEQRLVRELADGPHHAATVQELAAACEIDQRVAASTLKRLSDMRWVRADKSPELDRRHTWYRLREPLVRHHFQYRSARDQPLPLIVELLKAWYGLAERREQLIHALPGSETERLIAATLGDSIRRLTVEYALQNIATLQADARSWLHGAMAGTRTPEAGALIDIVITAAKDGVAAAMTGIGHRDLAEPLRTLATAITARARELTSDLSPEETIAELLRYASSEYPSGRTAIVLEMISAIWDIATRREVSAKRLQALFSNCGLAADDPLWLDLWFAQSVTPLMEPVGSAVYVDGLVHRLAETEPSVLVVLTAHFVIIYFLIGARDYATARDSLIPLVRNLAQQFGEENELTLWARIELAGCTGYAGDPLESMARLAELIEASDMVLGPASTHSIRGRMWLAACTAQAGEPALAIGQAWLVLAEEGVAVDIVDFLEEVIGTCFVQLMESPTVPTGWQEGGLVATLQAAAAGEEEAFMRLPAELADIVRAARAQNAQPAEASP